MENQESNIEEEQLINDEYKIWKKNTPFLYDLIMTYAMEWPSMTVQWLPEKTAAGDYTIQKLLIGTNAPNNEQNNLYIARVKLPSELVERDVSHYDEEGNFGGLGFAEGKLEIIRQIPHPTEVNRARYMPQDPAKVVTRTSTPDILLFNLDVKASPAVVPKPELTLKGHRKEGYGISWNPVKTGYLSTTAEDSLVCVWDINGNTKSANVLSPILKLRGHEAVTEDSHWRPSNGDTLLTCGDDGNVIAWDIRKSEGSQIAETIKAHNTDVNAVRFNAHSDFLFATGSSDCTVALWDLRNTKSNLHVLRSHTKEVYNLEWSPFNESVLASSALDRRVHIWDLSKIGEEQTPEDEEDGPAELLFTHGGHTAPVSDFAWNEKDAWLCSSVGEDNVLMIWQMAENVYVDEEYEILAQDLE